MVEVHPDLTLAEFVARGEHHERGDRDRLVEVAARALYEHDEVELVRPAAGAVPWVSVEPFIRRQYVGDVGCIVDAILTEQGRS